jgi:phospholipase/carboxylesterase
VLFMPGAQDPTVNPAATATYAALLTERGFRLTQETVPAGHNLTQRDIDVAAAWLQNNFPTSA